MAAITICSDFGAPKIKSDTVSAVSPSISHEVMVGTNYRVLMYCICHFQGGSLCFSFFCLLVSSASDFCPDTEGAVMDTFFRLTCSVVLWGGRDAANK